MFKHDVDTNSAAWVRSSYSDGGSNCVEAAAIGDYTGVRDSKLSGPVQLHAAAAWRHLLDDIQGKALRT
ncbi:DUF397 domain-containing protein [Yinghuangia seranimata]|uniref:DUF397 domain-containing protein n=1 Tax=Yinghuangia seranimata TaxID=408067 RepID=UPI00248B45D2|nr:DUF397 domain-containing protein [Yinghuangia seranimata]MDI2127161.1 DUF397 domain-containing protein [Yinghuangia seranimata]